MRSVFWGVVMAVVVCVAGGGVIIPSASAQQAVETRLGAHGLTLPGSFTGTLPCADCPGIVHHLDLWPGGGYALRLEYLERDEVVETLGRWYSDPARRAIVLDRPEPMQWQVLGNGDLRLLDREGQPIDSDLPYELVASPLDPVAISGPMTGMFTYFADAALFDECLTGQRLPVVMEADYLALERAYLEARVAPMAPLLASIDGRIAEAEQMEGSPRPSVTVERLHHVTPQGACATARPPAELVNSFWRVDIADGLAVTADAGWREPYLLLLPEAEDEAGGTARFSATMGCNMMMGSYSLEGDALEFGAAASTMMACPPPLDRLERVFAVALESVEAFETDGHSLRLLDAGGRIRVHLTAVHTPW